MTYYPILSGQFICGNKHCDEKNGLASYEVCTFLLSSWFNIIFFEFVYNWGITAFYKQLLMHWQYSFIYWLKLKIQKKVLVFGAFILCLKSTWSMPCMLGLICHSCLYFTFWACMLQVNFSYFEAGENKQALVKLVTCERWVGIYEGC